MADNPIDVWAAVKAMKDSKGWQLLMARYGKRGDDILTKILDVDTDNEMKYGKRDLYVYQLEALGILSQVCEEIEMEANNALLESKQPTHKGN